MRCAVYTRKSTEDGLDQEFNSLDAQREAGEAYIRSQAGEGWELIPDQYDDGGFTGGNMERPALRRLMVDIAAGKVDCVVVYKVDRLSRSLLDFSRILELFEKYRVSFVSVTQLFNTANSMGRLMLNVLLSFAQFEREIISERTRDKIAATRRKGKWTGGMPLLGYDVEQPESRLVINDLEAAQVRQIFQMYLEQRSLLKVVQELTTRGWQNKQWTTKKGTHRGGKSFTKTSLHKLLTNPTYLGKLKYKDELHEGLHEMIVAPELWQQVQTLLSGNCRNGGADVRNQFGAILKGLIRCSACDAAMVPSHTKRGKRRYRYYVCSSAQKRGWDTCPSKSVPAAEMERYVIDQIRSLGTNPDFRREVLGQVDAAAEEDITQRRERHQPALQNVRHCEAELLRLASASEGCATDERAMARLADVQDRLGKAKEELITSQQSVANEKGLSLEQDAVIAALRVFDPVRNALTPPEQGRVMKMLVQRIDYNGDTGRLEITFRPNGFDGFLEQFSEKAVA